MQDELIRLQQFLENNRSFLLMSHRAPDGDAVGSVAGFYHYLRASGKDAIVILPDSPSDVLLPFLKDVPVKYFNEESEQVGALMSNANALICLDFNASNRVGDLQELLDSFKGQSVMIDHHPDPVKFTEIVISDPENSSTCQLIFECLEKINQVEHIDLKSAESLYLGIMTDTGSFRFPSVNPNTHRILGSLMQKGVKHWMIHQQVFDNNRVEQLQLRGYAISEKLFLLNSGPNAIPFGYIALSQEELLRFNYKAGDTEGLVNVILSIEGIKAAVIVQEKRDGIKLSFRSKDNVYINQFAKKYFNGGGHKYAAGGSSSDSLSVTIERIVRLIPEIFS